MPSVERVIKIPPSMMLQSWMGSDFTSDNLVEERSIFYDYRHEVVSTTTVDSQEACQVEATARPDAPVT